MPKVYNLKGKEYGDIVVGDILTKAQDGSVVWEYTCKCGNIGQATTRNLIAHRINRCYSCKMKNMTESWVNSCERKRNEQRQATSDTTVQRGD